MKTIVAIGLMALFIFVAVVELRAYRTSVAPASVSESQIYIHGTPVCVFRQGESIVARVGECDGETAPPDEAPGDGTPDLGGPGLTLPPGHPPVGPDMAPDGNGRRIAI